MISWPLPWGTRYLRGILLQGWVGRALLFFFLLSFLWFVSKDCMCFHTKAAFKCTVFRSRLKDLFWFITHKFYSSPESHKRISHWVTPKIDPAFSATQKQSLHLFLLLRLWVFFQFSPMGRRKAHGVRAMSCQPKRDLLYIELNIAWLTWKFRDKNCMNIWQRNTGGSPHLQIWSGRE